MTDRIRSSSPVMSICSIWLHVLYENHKFLFSFELNGHVMWCEVFTYTFFFFLCALICRWARSSAKENLHKMDKFSSSKGKCELQFCLNHMRSLLLDYQGIRDRNCGILSDHQAQSDQAGSWYGLLHDRCWCRSLEIRAADLFCQYAGLTFFPGELNIWGLER